MKIMIYVKSWCHLVACERAEMTAKVHCYYRPPKGLCAHAFQEQRSRCGFKICASITRI